MTIFQMLIPVIQQFSIDCFIYTDDVYLTMPHKKTRRPMIREEGPSWHQVKAGTPTMGALVFNLAIIVTGFGSP